MNAPRPIEATNGLAIAGFVCSIIGLCAGGLLSPVGLILSLVALGKEPRGFAIAGVAIGAFGSCGLIVGALIAVLVPALLVAAAVGLGAGGVLGSIGGPAFNAFLEMGQLNAKLEAYHQLHGAYPASLKDLGLSPDDQDLLADGWSHPYGYTVDANGDYTLYSLGPDGQAGTSDDIETDPDFKLNIDLPKHRTQAPAPDATPDPDATADPAESTGAGGDADSSASSAEPQ